MMFVENDTIQMVQTEILKVMIKSASFYDNVLIKVRKSQNEIDVSSIHHKNNRFSP